MRCLSLIFLIGISCWRLGNAQTADSKPVVSVQAPPAEVENNPAAWKRFSPPEGRFSILIPGTPVSKTIELQTSAGKIINYVWLLKLPASFYHVGYMDYPAYSEDDEFVKRTRDAGRDGMLARNKGTKILGETQIAIDSFPGREFLILQDGFSFGIMRTLVVHGRLYESCNARSCNRSV